VGNIEEIDYVQFCGGARSDWETLGLNPGEGESRITASVRARFFIPFIFFWGTKPLLPKYKNGTR
jgi:hypothetical protein